MTPFCRSLCVSTHSEIIDGEIEFLQFSRESLPLFQHVRREEEINELRREATERVVHTEGVDTCKHTPATAV